MLTDCLTAQYLRMFDTNANYIPVFDFMAKRFYGGVLDSDTFWGPTFWKDVAPRALSLEQAIHQVARHSCILEKLVQTEERSTSLWTLPPRSHALAHTGRPPRFGIYRNLRGKIDLLAGEERIWIHSVVLGRWTTILADAAELQQKSLLSSTLHGLRQSGRRACR